MSSVSSNNLLSILLLTGALGGQAASPAAAPPVSGLLGGLSGIDLTQDNRYGSQRYGYPVQQPPQNGGLFGGLGQLLQTLLLLQLLKKLFAPSPSTPVTPSPSPTYPVAFNQVIAGNEHTQLGGVGMNTPTRSEVLNTDAQFNTAFLRLSGDYLDPNAFNAATESAVYLGLGSRNTGGYSVNVTSVTEENGKIIVRWSEGRPGPNDAVTQAFTAPAKLIKFANPGKLPVEIIKTN